MASNKVLKFYLSFQMDKASVDATLRDSKKIEAALADIRQEALKTRKAYDSLENVSTRVAAVGASILTPLILSAQKYATTVGNAEATSRKWLASTKALEQSQLELGRKAAQALQPYLDLAVTLSDKLADLPPGVIDAGVAIGGGLALVGAAGLLVASVGKFGTFVKEFGVYAANLSVGKAGLGGSLLGSGVAIAGGVGLGVYGGKFLAENAPGVVDTAFGSPVSTGIQNQLGLEGKPSERLKENASLDYLLDFFKQIPVVGLEALKVIADLSAALELAGVKVGSFFAEAGINFGTGFAKLLAAVELGFNNFVSIMTTAGDTIFAGAQLAILSVQRFLADISIKDPTGLIDIEFDELLGLDKNKLDEQIKASKESIDLIGQLNNAFEENNQAYDERISEIETSRTAALDKLSETTATVTNTIVEDNRIVKESLTDAQKAYYDFAFAVEDTSEQITNAVLITQEALEAFADFQANEADAFKESFQRRADIATEGHAQELKMADDFERNRLKQIEDFERQAAQARADFNRQQVQKLQDFNRQQKTELQDFQHDQLQAEQDFYSQRATDVAQFQKEDLQRLEDFQTRQQRAQEDHSQRLLEAAGRLDAIAVLGELRNFNTQSKREKQDFDKESQRRQQEQTSRLRQDEDAFNQSQKQRADQFQREQQDKATGFERDRQRAVQEQNRREADSRANFERQQSEQRNQNERSLAELRQQTIRRIAEETQAYAQQKQKRQQAFTEQLSQLVGFQTREQQARQAHYRVLEQQLQAFIARARVNTSTGLPATPNSNVATNRPGFASGGYTPGGTVNTSAGEFISNPFTTRLLEGALGSLTQQKLQNVAYDNSRSNQFNISITGGGNPTDVGKAVRREIETLLMQLGQGA